MKVANTSFQRAYIALFFIRRLVSKEISLFYRDPSMKKLTPILFTLIVLTGCSALFKPRQMYAGEERPETEVALFDVSTPDGWRVKERFQDYHRTGAAYPQWRIDLKNSSLNNLATNLTGRNMSLLPGPVLTSFDYEYTRQECDSANSRIVQGGYEHDYECHNRLIIEGTCKLAMKLQKGSQYYLNVSREDVKEDKVNMWLTKTYSNGDSVPFEGGCKETRRQAFPAHSKFGVFGDILGAILK